MSDNKLSEKTLNIRYFLESLFANSAYYLFMLYSMSRGVKAGILSFSIIVAASKLTTVLTGGALATSFTGFKQIRRSLFLSQAISLIAISCFFISSLEQGGWLLVLPLLLFVATVQVFENTLRSKIIGNKNNKTALSSRLYILSTHGSLVLSAVIFLGISQLGHLYSAQIFIPFTIAALLFLSFSSKGTYLFPTLEDLENKKKLSLAFGRNIYFANPFFKQDLCLAVGSIGSNSFTVFILGLHGGSAAWTVLISGVSIWLSPSIKKLQQTYFLMGLMIAAILSSLFVTNLTWVYRAIWVFIFNALYWMVYSGVTDKMYSHISKDHNIEFTAFRNTILIAILALGYLLSGLLLQKYGLDMLVATKVVLYCSALSIWAYSVKKR